MLLRPIVRFVFKQYFVCLQANYNLLELAFSNSLTLCCQSVYQIQKIAVSPSVHPFPIPIFGETGFFELGALPKELIFSLGIGVRSDAVSSQLAPSSDFFVLGSLDLISSSRVTISLIFQYQQFNSRKTRKITKVTIIVITLLSG